MRRRENEVIKSPHDERSYRALELANGMRILLVSDPATDRAAVSLSVRVGMLSLCSTVNGVLTSALRLSFGFGNAGSMSDPDELLGLAHFLEHMLLIGTDKYPEEDAYDRFIHELGG